MKVLFCRIAYMKNYKGINCNEQSPDYDVPQGNNIKYVNETKDGHERYNFLPKDDGYCYGFVETGFRNENLNDLTQRNTIHIEYIEDCESMKKEDFVDGVLVVWCSPMDYLGCVVGWYKNATVYRKRQQQNKWEDTDGYHIKVKASKENVVLLSKEERSSGKWNAFYCKKNVFGFGQSAIWYGKREKTQKYVEKEVKDLVNKILSYKVDNRYEIT